MKVDIFADTHEPGSLETLLYFLRHGSTSKGGSFSAGAIYSTGDHIPSGMRGPERELVDKIRAEGVKDVRPFLAKKYEEDPEYRTRVDAHNQKTIVNQNARKEVLRQKRRKIISCAGNQDIVVGRKLKEKYGGENILEDFKDTGLNFWLTPGVSKEYEMAFLMVPYSLDLRTDKRQFEEIREEVKSSEYLSKVKKAIEKKYVSFEQKSVSAKTERITILSHQSIDCTGMGLPEEARDAYTEPGNRALITAYYELACELVGPENVQLVHGHHHKPYNQYEFRGSKVHNLDIGDILSVDIYTGETEVKHVFQRY